MEINTAEIEKRWKTRWEETGVYKVSHKSDKPKYYVLDMFPYPSGSGLHVGHPLGYIASDIMSRYRMMTGYNVLHPMGYDAFGLPAEQYAIQSGIHPAIATEQNIDRYRVQLKNLGFNYDWSREVKTCDPKFYQWTQWIFLQLFNHYYDEKKDNANPISELIYHFEQHGTTGLSASTSGKRSFNAAEWSGFSAKEKDNILMNYRLAYRKTSYVNWCEALGTVLANDEIRDGVSERGGYPVERKAMLQWSLRITAYAERLLKGLDKLDWSDSMKTIQQNWIGKSTGAQLHFKLTDHDAAIEIFTTRPDTIFGATFMVIAPEHPLVPKITTEGQQKAVDDYLEYVGKRSERDRISEVKEVTGAFTGAYAINPFTKTMIPVWIAEYVLMEYGTGAIMAVPGDDQRDHVFAEKYDLPVIEIIDRSAYPDASIEDKVGTLKNSGFLDGKEISDAIETINTDIEKRDIGKRKVHYKMRDAIYSRQRYWGEPIPIVYDIDRVAHAIDEKELPLILPPLKDFKPEGEASPLARLKDWVNPPDGKVRETDTMPGYAGSSWYFLRYMDPGNDKAFASPEALQYWRDVDLYIGGTEHAVGHLMYARFWHKFLFDKGLVPTDEPFRKLVNQGMIQGAIEYIFLKKDPENQTKTFYSANLVPSDQIDHFAKIPVHIDFVSEPGTDHSHLDQDGIDRFKQWRPEFGKAEFHTINDKLYTVSEIGKMSKRYYNVVNPDDVIDEYGADCFRMYEMFLGPIEQSKPWDTQGIEGVQKFLRRLWHLFYNEDNKWIVDDSNPKDEDLRILHQTIERVRQDIERLSFNTCVSHMMICVNGLKKNDCHNKAVLRDFLLLMAPFAPFITEELWEKLGGVYSIHQQLYPEAEKQYLVHEKITYPVCINGKKRTEMEFDSDAPKEEIESTVLGSAVVAKWVDGKQVQKVIIVPKRMINIVV